MILSERILQASITGAEYWHIPNINQISPLTVV